MLFWKKNDEIILNCYTYSQSAYEFSRIDHATKYLPNWWIKTQKHNVVDGTKYATIKNCIAFINFFKKGIVIPSWFDMKVSIIPGPNYPNYKWVSSNKYVSTEASHSVNQFNLFTENNSTNMKLTSVWKFKTDEEIYFSWTQPTWSNKNILKYINILPGVTEFKYQHSTEINYLVRNPDEKEYEVEIPPQTPLVILHPLTEKKVKIVNHIISYDDWDKISLIDEMILLREQTSVYKKRKNIIDNLNRKCPFSHD